MSAVVLDSTPLGMLCHPRNPPHVAACRQWVASLQAKGRRVILPEIIDYEVRREINLSGHPGALRNLDRLTIQLEYLPLTTAMMRHAAQLWAQVRQIGQPTADPHALDVDAILAAQALRLGGSVIVATSNPAHLSRFVPADRWENIVP